MVSEPGRPEHRGNSSNKGIRGRKCRLLPVPRTVPAGVGERLCWAPGREGPYEKRAGPSAQLCLSLRSLGRWMVAGTQASWSPQSIINNLLLSKPIRKK